MVDHAHRARLTSEFDVLLADLAATWPAADIAYVREEVAHFEFGEALENLVALSRRNGHPFTPGQQHRVQALASAMGLRLKT